MENMFVFTNSEAIDIINFERAVRKMAMRLKVGMTNTSTCYAVLCNPTKTSAAAYRQPYLNLNNHYTNARP